jgi:hypothetical protein
VKHVCDVQGVLLEVEYSGPPPVEIRSVRVLDSHYRPTGPDLTFLLHDVLIMTAQDEAERFLSKLAGELP